MAVEVISQSYIAGFTHGVEAIIRLLVEEHPDLDDAEFGGPISQAQEYLEATLATFAKANGR